MVLNMQIRLLNMHLILAKKAAEWLICDAVDDLYNLKDIGE
jgi:hypothetical protein